MYGATRWFILFFPPLCYREEYQYGGEDLALAAGGGRAMKIGGTSSIRGFWLLETSFHAFIWILCSFIMFMVFDTHATYIDCQMANEIIINIEY